MCTRALLSAIQECLVVSFQYIRKSRRITATLDDGSLVNAYLHYYMYRTVIRVCGQRAKHNNNHTHVSGGTCC